MGAMLGSWLVSCSLVAPPLQTLLLVHELGNIARRHSLAQGHAPKIDRGRALVLLSIETDRHALQPLATRGETTDGYKRDQEGLATELSQCGRELAQRYGDLGRA